MTRSEKFHLSLTGAQCTPLRSLSCHSERSEESQSEQSELDSRVGTDVSSVRGHTVRPYKVVRYRSVYVKSNLARADVEVRPYGIVRYRQVCANFSVARCKFHGRTMHALANPCIQCYTF